MIRRELLERIEDIASANERKSYCKLCAMPIAKGEGHKFRTRRTGMQDNGTGACLCDCCITRLWGYGFENDTHVGKANKDDYTYGQEYESSFADAVARVEMALNHILPTSDCTVAVEFKSPVQHGLNSLGKWTRSMDSLIAEGHLSFSDTSSYKCGTHFHVGHSTYINNETLEYVRRFYNSLFFGLSELLKAHPTETKELFGRNFNETRWASPITMDTYAWEHTNFVNLQHSYSIEYRLCKFQSGEQYLRCAHCCSDITKAVVEGFIKKFGATTTTAERKALALATSDVIVKIASEYMGLA